MDTKQVAEKVRVGMETDGWQVGACPTTIFFLEILLIPEQSGEK